MRGRTASLESARRSVRLVCAAAVLLAVAACGGSGDGRTLRTPQPDQTTTTVASRAATAGVDAGSASADDAAAASTTTTAAAALALSSSAIPEGGAVPARYTCRADDVSPPLLWTGAPAGTVELALVVRDVDAEGFVHWVVAGLSPDLGGIAEDSPPAGAVEAANDFGRPGWAGPCPPAGTHVYELRVYALAQPSGVVAGEPGADAAARVEATPALASAVLSATATAG
jgi:Raf kinase inhibitor-like YbhB/YbcL family protein